jgi:hypothetical protein
MIIVKIDGEPIPEEYSSVDELMNALTVLAKKGYSSVEVFVGMMHLSNCKGVWTQHCNMDGDVELDHLDNRLGNE